MNNRFSFRNGWSQVRQGDARAVRDRLMEVLNITTRVAFLDRMNGKVEPKVTEHYGIESVFAEFGITDVWGQAHGITKINGAV